MPKSRKITRKNRRLEEKLPYKNLFGYADRTAYEAILLIREEQKERRSKSKRI